MNIYFSDIFKVDPKVIERYGAFNISLINDLPLFLDPFLLFNSLKSEYQTLHRQILQYVGFLRDVSLEPGISQGLLRNWFLFPEVKQNWLGFSESGNGGSGLGIDFAKSLNKNLNQVFTDFGEEQIANSSHLEKLCLIDEGVGKDKISDFTTNLIKGYLLEYTQKFAKTFIDPQFCRSFAVDRAKFNFDTRSWVTRDFTLPFHDDDYVLLTPKDMLTKDETWINKPDIVRDFQGVVFSIPNGELRAQINQYFLGSLPKRKKKSGKGFKSPTPKDIGEAVRRVLHEFPKFLDYYIRFKEINGDGAKSLSEERVKEVEQLFVAGLTRLVNTLLEETKFYSTGMDTLEESYQRVLFLKNVVENKDGYRIFYLNGQPIKRETDLHVMYRLAWYGSISSVNRESNEGRGPADFVISRGSADKTIVEFKLASNAKLRQNLANQVEIYKRAHDTDKAIKVIFFFSDEDQARAKSVLRELGLENEKYVVLVDARKDNKSSASKA